MHSRKQLKRNVSIAKWKSVFCDPVLHLSLNVMIIFYDSTSILCIESVFNAKLKTGKKNWLYQSYIRQTVTAQPGGFVAAFNPPVISTGGFAKLKAAAGRLGRC